MTFVGSATGSSLPIQLIYRGKSNKCLSKFTFFSNFYVTFTPNYCSNLVCSYFSTKKKDLGYPEEQHSLIIMDTFKGQDYKDLKQLCAKRGGLIRRGVGIFFKNPKMGGSHNRLKYLDFLKLCLNWGGQQ